MLSIFIETYGSIQPIGGRFGGFLSGDDRLVIFYDDEGESFVSEYTPGQEAPVELLNRDIGDQDTFDELIGTYFPNSRSLMFLHVSDSWRCYAAAPGQEAERVADGDYCLPTNDGSRIYGGETNSDGEITATLVGLDGGDEVTLLEDAAESGEAITSSDASHFAYTINDEDEYRLVLRTAEGEEVFESDAFEWIDSFSFAGDSNTVWFMGRNEDVYELHTSAGGGPLAEAPAMRVLPAPDGTTLAVLTADEDGAGEATVINLAGGESVEIASGDGLALAMIADPDRLLVREATDGDLRLTAAEWSGANSVTLVDESDYTFSWLSHLPGDDRLLLRLDNDDGNSLYVAPLDGSPGFFAIEEWSGFWPLNLAGDTLLLAGWEDEEEEEGVLYALSLAPDAAEPIALDDSGDIDWFDYPYATFTPDGRSVLYNAMVGDGADDVVVRQVGLDGEEPPQELFEGLALVDVAWGEIDPLYPYINSTSFFFERFPWLSARIVAQQ
jgi:hypothetical protein